MVQVDKIDSAVNFPQFLVRHFSIHVVLKEHGIEDEGLGSGEPMERAVFLVVLDKSPIDSLWEFKV